MNPKLAAQKAFIACEEACQITDERLSNYSTCLENSKIQGIHEIELIARRKLVDMLGDVPSLKDLDYAFGPGATLNTKKDTNPFKKLSNALQCAPNLISSLPEVVSLFPGWSHNGKIEAGVGSELSFVAKNAKTDRPICIEPVLNGLLQKAVGSLMKQRFKIHNLDLFTQERNQHLCKNAQRFGLSTVDFSSASDTVSVSTVFNLLPIDWALLLNKLRSTSYTFEKVSYPLIKFSSMGNGFTFELESALFFALAYAVIKYLRLSDEHLTVFGDDVILPRDAFDLYSKVTEMYGFTVNKEKSYKNGSFFESCGVDVFDARDVRAYYIKGAINNVPQYTRVANYVLGIQEKLLDLEYAAKPYPAICNTILEVEGMMNIHSWIVRQIPPVFRLPLPRNAPLESGLWSRPPKGAKLAPYGNNSERSGHEIYYLPSLVRSITKRVPDQSESFEAYQGFNSYVRYLCMAPRKLTLTDYESVSAMTPSEWMAGLSRCTLQDFLRKVPPVQEPVEHSKGYTLRGDQGIVRIQKIAYQYPWSSPTVDWELPTISSK